MGEMRPLPEFASVDIPPGVPVHRAEHLLLGKGEARIVLGDQVYTLRMTRAGKLILTK